MPGDKRVQLARHAIEMVGHRLPRLIRLARRQSAVDRFVLEEGSLQSPRLRQQGSAHALKMGADRVEHLADPRQTRALGDLPMESGVEFMETLQIAALDSRL